MMRLLQQLATTHKIVLAFQFQNSNKFGQTQTMTTMELEFLEQLTKELEFLELTKTDSELMMELLLELTKTQIILELTKMELLE